MDFIEAIPLIGPTLSYILPFLAVISIVVAVHEYGHYIVGRWCGIHAEVFSIGFGKVVYSRVDRRGTRWQIAALPLGGYVKFTGDMDPASAGRADDADLSPEDRRRAFHNATLLRRALTVLAGPVANFILAIAIFAGLAIHTGKWSNEPVIASVGETVIAETGFREGDRVLEVDGAVIETFADLISRLQRTNGAPTPVVVERGGAQTGFTTRYILPPRITDLVTTGAAAHAGLQPGDILLNLAGRQIVSSRDVQEIGAALPHDQPIEVIVDREGKTMTFEFVPDIVERAHPVSGEVVPYPQLGILMQEVGGLAPPIVSVGVIEALGSSVTQVGDMLGRQLLFLNQMLFHGADTSQLSGPIGIAKFSGDAAQHGVLSFIRLVAFLSLAIGLFNLFPIPVLDGGHLMFYAAEAVLGRPLGEVWMRYGTMVGLSLVLLLMVFVTYNDIIKL